MKPRRHFKRHVETFDFFFQHVDKQSGELGCWMWTGRLSYPKKFPTFMHNGKEYKGRRFCWEKYWGPIPVGMYVGVKCGHKMCVRPDHLVLRVYKTYTRNLKLRELL